jgi:hypothetical protein
VVNSGTAPLNFSAMSYPADFPEAASAANDCKLGTPIAVAKSCTFTAVFQPTTLSANGTLSEEITFTTDAATTPVSIPVSGTVTGAPPTPTIAFSSTPSGTAISGQSVSLTATLTGLPGLAVPTGAVTFSVSGTTLGTASLNGGVATFATTSLPLGADTVTASYSGDSLYGAASTTLSITVTAPPGFTMQLSSPTLTVANGSIGSEAVTITSQNSFNQQVSFACSGLPQFATCTFTPSTVTPVSNATASTSLSIDTNVTAIPAVAARRQAASLSKNDGTVLSLAVLGIGIFFVRRHRKTLRSLRSTGMLFVVISLLSLATLTGCGGGGSPAVDRTPSGTSTITVTATSGSLTQTATFSLTVH